MDNLPIEPDSDSLNSSRQDMSIQNERTSFVIEPYESLSHLNLSVDSIESSDMTVTTRIDDLNQINQKMENNDSYDVCILNQFLKKGAY